MAKPRRTNAEGAVYQTKDGRWRATPDSGWSARRQDGRRVFPQHEFHRARGTSLAVEQQYGLTRTSPASGQHPVPSVTVNAPYQPAAPPPPHRSHFR